MTATRFDITAADGTVITAEYYEDNEQPVKCVVVVSHGFGEHIGNYRELAHRLAQGGYACVLFDQRGHGAACPKPAPGQKDVRGIISGYRVFLDDVGEVVAEVKRLNPGIPVALYGHSMGGNIIVNYLLNNDQSGYLCAVLEAPWLGLFKDVNLPVAALAKVIGRITPKAAIFNKLSPGDLTGDASRAEGYKTDPLYHNRISFRMFTGVRHGCKTALKNAEKLTVPIFLAYAANDRIVSNRAIGQFVESAGRCVTKKEYGSCHAIRNDSQNEVFFRDVIGFLDQQIMEQ